MGMPNIEIDAGAAVNIDDVDLLLADLEIDEQEETEIEIEVRDEEIEGLDEALTEIEADLTEEDVAAAVTSLAIEEAKTEAYEAAEGEGYEIAESEVAPAKVKKTKKVEGPKTPRAPKMADSLAPESFVLSTEDDIDDLEALKTAVLAKCPSQKKIAEKFHNLLCAVAAGKLPSTYTMDCFRALEAKGGEILSTELVAALQAKGYSIGTARAQSGQIMVLFNVLGIATRAGNKLTANSTSTLAIALRTLDAAAAEGEA